MTNLKTLLATAAFCAVAFAAPAQAAVPVCTVVGLDDIVPNAQACAGYFQGNLLNNSNIVEQTAALASIGLTWGGVTLEKLSPGSTPLNFATLLNGLTWIGIHYGKGQGPVDVSGGVTAFYRFNAGTNLDTFGITPGSISGVSLYATTPPAVPEPGTWALMLAGMGIAGAAMRRRNTRSMLSFS